jgi:hypothetical protein
MDHNRRVSIPKLYHNKIQNTNHTGSSDYVDVES